MLLFFLLLLSLFLSLLLLLIIIILIVVVDDDIILDSIAIECIARNVVFGSLQILSIQMRKEVVVVGII